MNKLNSVLLLRGKVGDLNEFLVNTALPQSDRAILPTGSEARARQIPFDFQRGQRVQLNRVQLLNLGLSEHLPREHVLDRQPPHEDLLVRATADQQVETATEQRCPAQVKNRALMMSTDKKLILLAEGHKKTFVISAFLSKKLDEVGFWLIGKVLAADSQHDWLVESRAPLDAGAALDRVGPHLDLSVVVLPQPEVVHRGRSIKLHLAIRARSGKS